jgi:hypothetical protein
VNDGELPGGVGSVKGDKRISLEPLDLPPSFTWCFIPSEGLNWEGQQGVLQELTYRWGWQLPREGVPWVAQRV